MLKTKKRILLIALLSAIAMLCCGMALLLAPTSVASTANTNMTVKATDPYTIDGTTLTINSIADISTENLSEIKNVYVASLDVFLKSTLKSDLTFGGNVFGYGENSSDDSSGLYNLYINNELVTNLLLDGDILDRNNISPEKFKHLACSSIESAVIKNFDHDENRTSELSYAFYGCRNLRRVEFIGNTFIMYNMFNMSGGYMEWMDNMSSTLDATLTGIELIIGEGCIGFIGYDFGDNNVDYKFADEMILKSITIPSTITNLPSELFYGHYFGLKTMTFYGATAPTIGFTNTDIEGFYWAENFKIIVPRGKLETYAGASENWGALYTAGLLDEGAYTNQNGVIYDLDDEASPKTATVSNFGITAGTSVTIPEKITIKGVEYLVKIASTAFDAKFGEEITSLTFQSVNVPTGLDNATLPSGIQSINVPANTGSAYQTAVGQTFASKVNEARAPETGVVLDLSITIGAIVLLGAMLVVLKNKKKEQY